MEPVPYDWSRPNSPGDFFRAWLEHHPFTPPEPPRAGLREWQDRMRADILDRLSYKTDPVDLKGEIIRTEEREAFRIETIRFNTSAWTRVPAFFLIPKNAKKPCPGIVCLHDHGGMYYWGKEKVTGTPHDAHPVLSKFKQDYYGGRSVADELAARGYAVLVIDMYHWGERAVYQLGDKDAWRTRPVDLPETEVHEFNRIASGRLELTSRALSSMGAAWLGMMLNDDIRSVDYLLSRREVDAERIGCVGLSVGGYRSAWLSFMDPRIRAAVVVGWMCRLRDCVDRTYNTIGHMKTAPGVFAEWDLPDLAALRIPQSLMVLQCRQDGLFPLAGMKNALERIESLYKASGSPENFLGRFYEVPHCFNQEMQDDSFAFLDKTLSR